MSKFITFDGVKYFNSQTIRTIRFEDMMQQSSGNEYAYCDVFVDEELFYSTQKYKYYDEDGEVEDKLEMFYDEVKRLKSLLV